MAMIIFSAGYRLHNILSSLVLSTVCEQLCMQVQTWFLGDAPWLYLWDLLVISPLAWLELILKKILIGVFHCFLKNKKSNSIIYIKYSLLLLYV